MKKTTLILAVLLCFALDADAQDNQMVKFGGMYIAQTGGEGVSRINKEKTFMCLRFYEDGKMYMQTTPSYSPDATFRWFGKKSFEYSGNSQIERDTIVVMSNNGESANLAIDGPLEMNFRGKIISPELLKIEVEYDDGRREVFDFRFVKIDSLNEE